MAPHDHYAPRAASMQPHGGLESPVDLKHDIDQAESAAAVPLQPLAEPCTDSEAIALARTMFANDAQTSGRRNAETPGKR